MRHSNPFRIRRVPGGATGLAVRVVLVAALGATAAPMAIAQVLTDQDCREGSDFIRNAALSRDNGISHQEFAERLEGDIAVVMRMPMTVRWFVYTEAEASLLRRQVDGVFSAPDSPETHHLKFLRSCHQLRVELALKRATEPLIAEPTPRSSGR